MRWTTDEEWAVYLMPVKGSPDGLRGVCPQAEWEALDRAKPGVLTLIQGHLPSEAQAEQLARGRSGEKPTRAARDAALVAASEARARG